MQPSDLKYKTIVYAALDWGLGHVSRSIGIIRDLLNQENKVILACNEEQKSIFLSYFPHLEYLDLAGYDLSFRGKGNWAGDLFRQRRHFFAKIKQEELFVKSLVKHHDIDCIISDHRYGFRHPNVHSIFVTHQLQLPISPWLFFIQHWHEKQIRKFQTTWVLDTEKSELAGTLSQRIKHPEIRYIGWKSRFESAEAVEKKYDYLIVISGPRPYSEYLLDEIRSKIDLNRASVAVLHPKSVTFPAFDFDFYPAENLKANDALFHQSACIISRSGYSTLMDLKILQKKGILIPTPGQNEQIYLANKLSKDVQFEFIFT